MKTEILYCQMIQIAEDESDISIVTRRPFNLLKSSVKSMNQTP